MVIVSHSAKIAEGIVDLAGQMAPGVRILAAGGTDDGGLGTSFSKVMEAVVDADATDGVVLLCDLGSAIMTAETALDFLDDDLRARVRIVDAPVVEGAVAAAVAAEIGGDLDGVVEAALSANQAASTNTTAAARAADTAGAVSDAATAPDVGTISGSATLINPSGLHARPVAEFVRLASRFDATVTVEGVDGTSMLRIMSLGLGIGASVRVEATGPQAREAVDALIALLESGFGE